MAFKEMRQEEVDHLLRTERVVRVGFQAGAERYLVPLGFVWHLGALCAMTTRGRKTRLAAASPDVSFQVDTSARTGPFRWSSVSGVGAFEIVTDPAEIEAIAALLASCFADMPEWMQSEYALRQERGHVVFVRIRPSQLAGRTSEPA